MTGKNSRKQGFTLIELLVAIFLTAIVFSMSLGIYLSVQGINSNLGADADVRDQLTDAQMALTDFVRRYDRSGLTYQLSSSALPGTGQEQRLSVMDPDGTLKALLVYDAANGTLTWTEAEEQLRSLSLSRLESLTFDLPGNRNLLRCTMTYGEGNRYFADISLRAATFEK